MVGVTSAQFVPDVAIAAGGAILAMHLLHCMHPPGSATALLAVVGGDTVHSLGYQFLFSPVAINVAIMMGCTLLYWRLGQRIQLGTSGRRLETGLKRSEEQWLTSGPSFSDDDLNRAMTEMDTFLDISRNDLKEIYTRAEQHAHSHRLGNLRCADAMSYPVIAVEYGTDLEEVWSLMEKYDIRGLPVVDRARHVIGIVTISDFVHHADQLPHETLAERLAHLRYRTTSLESDKPEVAGQIMTHPVLTANEDQPLSDFAQLLKLVPRHEFEPLVKQHHVGRKLRKTSRWSQFIALTLGQLSGRQSLRDIESNMKAQRQRLYHLGTDCIARSSLARLNEQQPYTLYEALFAKLHARCVGDDTWTSLSF